MRILVAGATGAIGKPLVPRLVAAGHEVIGMTRTASKQALLRDLGAEPAVADALDPDQVARAVAESEPEVIVHQLTAIPKAGPRRFERDFALTNRLRTEGTDHLLAAGRAAGVGRFVAQSYGATSYARSGGPVKTEADPLDPDPPRDFRAGADAIRYLERRVLEAAWTDGVVLRYGGFYGPDTSLAADGPGADAIRKRKFPIVGDGGGVWSFVHVEDAADATVLAVERGRPGTYNIVDDEPAPVAEWLPVLAEAFGAKPPRRFPRVLARLLAGEAMTVMMTEARGASNMKAKRELGWQPRHPTWRTGFFEDAARAASEAEQPVLEAA